MPRSLTDRLDEFLGSNRENDDRDADAPVLWAKRRTFSSAVLAALTDAGAPRTAWLILAAHGIALAGRPTHQTQMAVLAGRCGIARPTAARTTGWLVDHDFLARKPGRRFARGERWSTALERRSQFAAYGTISSHWLRVIAAERDRAALARTSLAVACLLGSRRTLGLNAAEIAVVSGEPPQHARTRVARLRAVGLIVVDAGAVSFGARWPGV